MVLLHGVVDLLGVDEGLGVERHAAAVHDRPSWDDKGRIKDCKTTIHILLARMGG